jgi:hypothetical protein
VNKLYEDAAVNKFDCMKMPQWRLYEDAAVNKFHYCSLYEDAAVTATV